jgi:cellulose synthase (UDP-forming)
VLLGIVPIIATIPDWAFFFLPLYLVQFSTFAWLNHRSRAALISDVYSVIQCFPISATVVQTLISPFSKGFQVTPKGTVSKKAVFHWQLALPLIVLAVLSIGCFTWQAYVLVMHPEQLAPEVTQYWQLGLIWTLYNLLVLAIAILSFIDVPKPDAYEWFEQRRTVQLEIDDQVIYGVTVRLSEAGAEVALAKPDLPVIQTNGTTRAIDNSPVKLNFPNDQLALRAIVTSVKSSSKDAKSGSRDPVIKLAFEQLNVNQHRRLIELLFCNPGQWRRQSAPGELKMLWLLLRSLIRPRALSKYE